MRDPAWHTETDWIFKSHISKCFNHQNKPEVLQTINILILCMCVCVCVLVARSCPALCNPMDCSMPGSPVLHYLLEFAQTHVHWVGDAIQSLILCCPLLLLPSVFPSANVNRNATATSATVVFNTGPRRWPDTEMQAFHKIESVTTDTDSMSWWLLFLIATGFSYCVHLRLCLCVHTRLLE